MGFSTVKEYVDSVEGGRFLQASIRKVPSQASVAGRWVDLSMAAGNPKPQYYAAAPFVAATLPGIEGIYHGDDKDPQEQYISEILLTTPTAGLTGRYMLLDYLLFYPFVELDNLDTQTMDNTTPLPRYADGEGVRIMLVAQAPTGGNEVLTIEYINQAGVTKTTPTVTLDQTSVGIASIPTSRGGASTNQGAGPFVRLADGDTGVRSITSVTVTVGGGGLAAVVLVHPLADAAVFEINTPSERSAITQRVPMPRVLDDAYLGFIMQCNGSVAAGQVAGRINYAWTE